VGKIAAHNHPLISSVGSWGLENVLQCAGVLIEAFPNAPKRRNARGVKKIKTPCKEVSKSISPNSIFIFSHCQVSGKVSQSGVWLAPNEIYRYKHNNFH
jgi:hypothetical protein